MKPVIVSVVSIAASLKLVRSLKASNPSAARRHESRLERDIRHDIRSAKGCNACLATRSRSRYAGSDLLEHSLRPRLGNPVRRIPEDVGTDLVDAVQAELRHHAIHLGLEDLERAVSA